MASFAGTITTATSISGTLSGTAAPAAAVVASDYRIVLLGAGAVGKSSLSVRYTQRFYLEEYDPTIEDCYSKRVTVDGEEAQVELVDTAGQEEYSAMRDQYIRMADGFVLVFAITSRSSFDEVLQMIQHIRKVRGFAGHHQQPPIVIVGNKVDLEYMRQIRTMDAQAIAANHGVLYIEASAKLVINVDRVFEDAIRLIRKHRAQALPPTPSFRPFSPPPHAHESSATSSSRNLNAGVMSSISSSINGGRSAAHGGPASTSKHSLVGNGGGSGSSAPGSPNVQPSLLDRLRGGGNSSNSSGDKKNDKKNDGRPRKISVSDIRRTDLGGNIGDRSVGPSSVSVVGVGSRVGSNGNSNGHGGSNSFQFRPSADAPRSPVLRSLNSGAGSVIPPRSPQFRALGGSNNSNNSNSGNNGAAQSAAARSVLLSQKSLTSSPLAQSGMHSPTLAPMHSSLSPPHSPPLSSNTHPHSSTSVSKAAAAKPFQSMYHKPLPSAPEQSFASLHHPQMNRSKSTDTRTDSMYGNSTHHNQLQNMPPAALAVQRLKMAQMAQIRSQHNSTIGNMGIKEEIPIRDLVGEAHATKSCCTIL